MCVSEAAPGKGSGWLKVARAGNGRWLGGRVVTGGETVGKETIDWKRWMCTEMTPV